MKAAKSIVAVLVIVAVIVAAYVGSKKDSGQVIVGGKNFTEQTIVGEMAALLIEQRAGLTVVRKFGLATNLPMKMIQKGELDVYLDYTGTGYVDILGKPYEQQPPEEIYEHVRSVYPEKFGAEWLSPLGFKNTYTLTMRRQQAVEMEIESISDLAAKGTGLRAGFDPGFLDRSDGYPGLSEFYGFKFAGRPSQLAIGLMYTTCAEGQVDVIDAFSTDGRIAKFDLKVLDDDKRFFPPYDAAFVVRSKLLGRHPKVREALELLAGKLNDPTMQKLNYSVDEEQRRESDVAREFLESEGLIGPENAE